MSDPFTYAVIGKAMQVHRELGPGLDEVFYHELLSRRLCEAGIANESRARGRLIHREHLADTFEADLIFPGQLIGELKCLSGAFSAEHFVQIYCYLKFWKTGTGMLFDFGKNSLISQRVNFSEPMVPPLDSADLLRAAPDLGPDFPLGRTLCESINRIISAHGLGYRDTTYRGLLAADLAAEGIPHSVLPVTPVRFAGELLGEARCNCLTVGRQFAVSTLALRETITATDRAVLQTYLRLLGLPHGLILNFGRTAFGHLWVGARDSR